MCELNPLPLLYIWAKKNLDSYWNEIASILFANAKADIQKHSRTHDHVCLVKMPHGRGCGTFHQTVHMSFFCISLHHNIHTHHSSTLWPHLCQSGHHLHKMYSSSSRPRHPLLKNILTFLDVPTPWSNLITFLPVTSKLLCAQLLGCYCPVCPGCPTCSLQSK